MYSVQPLLVALLGIGKIGRELIRRTISSPNYRYVTLVDTSGALAKREGFSVGDLEEIVTLKERGGKLFEMEGRHDYFESFDDVAGVEYDVLVDATDAQTYPLLYKALDQAHVVASNKTPIADVPYPAFQELTSKAERLGRVFDFGVTVGAGMRTPDLIKQLGADGLERVEGCLSGAMNYLSQRLNERVTLSTALKEAMNAPRYYTEPDPRVDLEGCDFARKLTIIARLCGRGIERSDVDVEGLVPLELRRVPIEVFLKHLPSLDEGMAKRVEKARAGDKALWYVGTADLDHDEYSVGFREVPLEDLIAGSGESDNVLKIYPRLWRRPVTIIGPGAGVPEAVTGMIAGLSRVRARVRLKLGMNPTHR